MVFNKPYQHPQESVVSYAFSDTATGLSYIPFYATNADLDGNEQMKLITTATLSTQNVYDAGKNINFGITTWQNGTVATYPGLNNVTPNRGTIEYETKFNVPLTLSGAAIINFTHGIGSAASCPNGRVKTVISLRKNGVHVISGASQINGGVVNTHISWPTTISFEVPLTHFKIGDSLGIDVDAWVGGSGANQVRYGIGTDGGDRDDPNTDGSGKTIEDADKTQFVAYLPVRADLN